MEKALILFIMAESFHPSIQHVLQQAKRFDVTAVVATHVPEIFPADIFPLLHVANGLDLTVAVRALVGGATDSCMITMDLADIREYVHQSRRSVQKIGVASAANQLPFAAQLALDRFSISGADLTLANSLLVWIRAGEDLLVDDYRRVMLAVDGRVSEDCLVNVAVDNRPAAVCEASVIVTASWA
jgi:cell division GTPase FtsZ